MTQSREKMSPKALRRKIDKLRIKAPIAARYERALIARGIWNNEGVWYASQKEHWLGWLSEYDGPGAYNRTTKLRRSAEFVYNHVNCPPMLLWLVEAAGVPKRHVLAAKRSALESQQGLGTQCARIRRAIPWPVVEERLRCQNDLRAVPTLV